MSGHQGEHLIGGTGVTVGCTSLEAAVLQEQSGVTSLASPRVGWAEAAAASVTADCAAGGLSAGAWSSSGGAGVLWSCCGPLWLPDWRGGWSAVSCPARPLAA